MFKLIIFFFKYLTKLETCPWCLVFLSWVLRIGMLVALFAMLSCNVVMILTVVHFYQ